MFTSSSGFIRLPANPTEYSASVNCNYTISTNNASTFSLGVSSLQLPQILDSLADCDRDYILVGALALTCKKYWGSKMWLKTDKCMGVYPIFFEGVPGCPSIVYDYHGYASSIAFGIHSHDYFSVLWRYLVQN